MNPWISIILLMYVTHNGDCIQQHVGYATNGSEAMIVTGNLEVYLQHVTTYRGYSVYVSDSTFYSINTELTDAGMTMVINELEYRGRLAKNHKPLHKRQYQTRKFRSTRDWLLSSYPCKNI